jgi:hypothetical protein
VNAEQTLPARRRTREQIIRHMIINEGVEALSHEASTVANLLYDAGAIQAEIRGASMPGLAVLDRAVAGLREHTDWSLALVYEFLIRRAATSLRAGNELSWPNLLVHIDDVVQRLNYKARHGYARVKRDVTRPWKVDSLVNMPAVDTFAWAGMYGILCDEVAILAQDGLDEVDHGRSIDKLLEQPTTQEHLISDDPARATARIRPTKGIQNLLAYLLNLFR